ncbi:protein MCM10 homolog isoform X1 [Hippocampus comes]|uniref:protein MCM10 homolog isoform X1 n=2 Tax=Hippocampus comes TaxID=109280 RepID=UPI00094E7C6C|nr:PREDICTED: protein MCM10 homolog isoform X1 [Hippocampus comes]XP_019747403.1 PREDICTED: protein MCM10 homolog isoform X2 [Hippocampus comes]XP_019747405.1 PREDICTED: protein MCM10 homolog isoform X1 [Hippocampus comes]
MDCEDDLGILTALMAENEGRGEEQKQQQADDFDDLFDNDDEDEEGRDVEPEDELTELFGDVDDIRKEEQVAQENKSEASESLNRSQEELQEELRRMQEKMQALQKQLEASQSASCSSSLARPSDSSPSPKPSLPGQAAPKRIPAAVTQKTNSQSVTSTSSAVRTGSQKVQESSDFISELSTADSLKGKPRVAHQSKPNTSPQDRVPLVEIKMGSSFLPVESTSKAATPRRQSATFQSRPCSTTSSGSLKLDSLPKDVAMEKYSGLRLRKPRVSSSDMDRKMADRRLIRLSQVPDRLQREKLEDSDWVTFGVLVSKATPQSNNSGKTFSIWKLNDLHNLDVFVSLFLFGDVHKEHWKTETGTVIGILNPNPMKQKDGYDEVSLTVDHPQKVLLMGEAQDYGTCKAMKKNGDPCSQLVNMYECQYCQYHVKAQYKKMCSKRSELQSSFSGKAPNKVKGVSLRERICQDGFHYGGVSSAACAASLSASKVKKNGQTTLDKLFVKGSARHILQAKMLALKSGEVSNCSDEFKSLMSVPSPGALQLKKHLTQGRASVSTDPQAAPFQSVSASDLLKQQKQKQREFLLNRQRRVVGSQAAEVPKPTTPSLPASPKAALGVPKTGQSPATPQTPTLGRGFSKGEDVLFFDASPLPAPAAALSLSSAKLAALKKLRAKGMALEKEDPNAVKRKRTSDSEISARVEKSLTSPDAERGGADAEPAEKKKRDELRYIQSEEFQKILAATSLHGAVLQAAEYQLQEQYFDPLVKKEQMEEKMKGIREMKCRAVSCQKCNYTYFKPADRCVGENHPLRWHDAVKRFFKCPCGQRAVALDRLPHKHCSNCGLFKWQRDGMLKEKTGPKIGGELLKPRGEEHAKFLNSLK